MGRAAVTAGATGAGASGRVALVTGAARGIGAAIARHLAGDGWALVLVDRCADDPALDYPLATPEDLATVVASCTAAGAAGVVAVVADVRDRQALDRAAAEADLRFGGLDAAVAAAGVIAGGPPTWETDDEQWDAMVSVNLTGVRNTAAAAIPHLLARPAPRSGRFVAVASTAAVVGLPRLSAYSAAKHGVLGLVRSLAAELGPDGVTANAVAPGSTETDMLQASAAVYELSSVGEFAQHHLDPRLLRPEEIAAAVVWLCGTSSSGVNGAVLPVDAGMTAK